MLTKVAFGLAIVLASASVSLAATHVHRNHGQTTVSTVTYPVENCDIRVTFPSCSGGGGQ
jgi:hypothetical protein